MTEIKTPLNGQPNTTAQQAPNQQAVPMVQEKNIADNVMNRIKVFEETGTLNLPKDYSAANAIRAAWLILQEVKTVDKRPVLQACTKESIANALFKMVTQGLNPVKRQCSFIAYGSTLTLQREYAGTIAIAKRDAGVTKVLANAVFKDDDFAYEINPETLQKKITKHIQTLDSISGLEIKGAYAIVYYANGESKVEIMSMAQIKKAWDQGATKGQSPAHKNFPDQMACKTVINRALKIDVNSSDDGALFEDVPEGDDVKTAYVKSEVENKGNLIEAGFEKETKQLVDNGTGEVINSEATVSTNQPETEQAPY